MSDPPLRSHKSWKFKQLEDSDCFLSFCVHTLGSQLKVNIKCEASPIEGGISSRGPDSVNRPKGLRFFLVGPVSECWLYYLYSMIPMCCATCMNSLRTKLGHFGGVNVGDQFHTWSSDVPKISDEHSHDGSMYAIYANMDPINISQSC